MTWLTLIEIFKTAILPVIGVLWAVFWNKIKKFDAEIDKLKIECAELRIDVARLSAEMVTRDDMDTMLKEFEARIDKTIALNLKPISDLLNRFMDNVSMQMQDNRGYTGSHRKSSDD